MNIAAAVARIRIGTMFCTVAKAGPFFRSVPILAMNIPINASNQELTNTELV